MAKSYITEHLRPSHINDEELEFVVELCREYPDLIRGKFQSRHSNQKTHTATIQFVDHQQQPIQGWYCTCSSGGREVGMCSHVTALLWHLGVEGATIRLSSHPLSVARLLVAVDNSMQFTDSETDPDEDNGSAESTTDSDEDSE